MALPRDWRVEKHPVCDQAMYIRRIEGSDLQRHQWVRPIAPPGFAIAWPPIYHAAHILIKHRAVRNTESHNRRKGNMKITATREEALATITELRNKLQQGAPFEQLAREWSDCSSYEKGGDLGWKRVGVMYPVFEKAALNTDIGVISEPFESPSGWHIVRRLDGVLAHDWRKLKDPPPIDLELELTELLAYVKDIRPTSLKEMRSALVRTETNPQDKDPWNTALTLYMQNYANFFTPLTKRLVAGYMFYHRDRASFEYVKEILSRKLDITELERRQFQRDPEQLVQRQAHQRALCEEEILCRILDYTWDPYFWGEWVSRTENTDSVEERIRKRGKMLKNVGFTTNTAKIWEQYVKLLKDADQPQEMIIETLKRALEIGLSQPDILVLELEELAPELGKEMRDRQNDPVVRERVKARERILRLRTEPGPNTVREFRKFLDEELANPLNYPEQLFVEAMDYHYRLALSVMWEIPSIWMEYWSFLVKAKSMNEKADRILALGRAVVGDTPKFELRRAHHLIKYDRFPEAEKILKHLIQSSEGKPMATSALTLLFRAVADLDGEEKAMHIITDNLQYALPQFFANAARMCQDPKTAWSIFQMGVDRFPDNDSLVIAAAEFLEQHRDVRNARLLFQQSLTDKRNDFEIRRQLFQFELDHIAPLDHLNETQKVFTGMSVDPLVLYMQRYRFMDLYPIGTDELRVLGHLTANGTFDLTDTPNKSDYLTTIPPYGVDPETLKRDPAWIERVERRMEANDGQQVQRATIPHVIHRLLKDIRGCQLRYAPPDVDEVIDRVTKYIGRPDSRYH